MINNFLVRIKDRFRDWLRGTSPLLGGVGRSSKWPKIRADFLKLNPNCEVCGGNKKISIHHKKPFHLFPELETSPDNLISLCEKNGCHLRFGHLYSFLSYNPDIEADASDWYLKIKTRP